MLSASKSGSGLATGYNLTRSLRFRSSASAYLSRTPASAGNRKTWTWSAWVKRGVLGTTQSLFGCYGSASDYTQLTFIGDALYFYNVVSGGSTIAGNTAAVYRDPSAWYHIVVYVDTTQATNSNGFRIYVNGVLQSFTYSAYTQNTNTYLNLNAATVIGQSGGSTQYFDGYLTEVNFIDGQALTPSSFGSTNALTGVWQPARYTGSYGTNGFYLPFTDNSALTTSSNVGLGKDFSGNGNYWTTNNISITAGVTYDSMTDVPTLTSATAANFPVLNPLAPNLAGTPTISNANLFVNCASASNFSAVPATMQLPTSGKWYAEFTATLVSTVADIGLLGSTDIPPASGVIGSGATSYGYRDNGNKINNGTSVAYGASYTTGDVIAIAFDATAGSLTFYKNNVSQGVAFTGLTAQYFFAVGGYNFTQWTANFGQRPFSYTPPTGFVALCTYNLPTSTIVKGNTVFDATLYTGTLLSNAVTNAASFKPDLVWVKSRSAATDNKLTDSVRGVTKGLISNTTGAETTDTQGLTAFNTNGFTVGTNTDYNNLTGLYVGWQWQAGQGVTNANTNGTITSTVSVNASAGFGVVTWTNNNTANQSIGHGLGVTPSLIITKDRDNGTYNWATWFTGFTANEYLLLNTTGAKASFSSLWYQVPDSSKFYIGSTGTGLNAGTDKMVAYCWTPIAGFSAFGSYTGNGSADGTFVYTGFRPKFVLFKRTDTTGDWVIEDTARSTFNQMDARLFPYLADAEVSNGNGNIDYLSNGFKLRNSAASMNASGGTYIYMAFAENPLKYALAR